MNNQVLMQRWLDDPMNPELIEQIERIAQQGGGPVIIDDKYIGRMVEQREARDTPSLAHARPPVHAGADKTGRS